MDTKDLPDIDSLIQELNSNNLILYNDNVNTFDHVARCLMVYCGHTSIQSEQCVITAHNNGKCSIKKGQFDELVELHKILSKKQLTVEIQ